MPNTHLTTIRLPESLWLRLVEAATLNKRSANKEIEFALEQHLAHTPTTAPRGEGEGGEGRD